MPQSSNAEYSGPFKKASLLLHDQYLGGPQFPTLGAWDRAQKDDLFVVKGTVGRTSPAIMIIVGVISSDKHSLFSHGNYSQTYGDPDKVGKAKLMFYLAPPSDDPDFSSDYKLALVRLAAIQNDIAQSDKREHFMESGGRLKFNFQLFGEKGTQSELSEPYDVADTYKDLWESASIMMDNRIMDVFDENGDRVHYKFFSSVFRPGTLVETHFELRHYAITDRTSNDRTVKSDTFSAHVHMVSILKHMPRTSIAKSPSKKPSTITQRAYKGSSVTRGEQERAALAFVPKIGGPSMSVAQNEGESYTAHLSKSSSSNVQIIYLQPSTAAEDKDALGTLQPLITSVNNPLLKQLLPALLEQLLMPSSPLLAQLSGAMGTNLTSTSASVDPNEHTHNHRASSKRNSREDSASPERSSPSSSNTMGTALEAISNEAINGSDKDTENISGDKSLPSDSQETQPETPYIADNNGSTTLDSTTENRASGDDDWTVVPKDMEIATPNDANVQSDRVNASDKRDKKKRKTTRE